MLTRLSCCSTRHLTFGNMSNTCVVCKNSSQAFDGLSKLLSFLDRVFVWTSVTEYEEKKKALARATRFENAAIENYRRLTYEETSNYSTIETLLI